MNSQQESNFFKQKRDEYLVEIRKKKISDQLQAKRIKIALASDQAQNADTITQPIPDLASSFTSLYKAGTLEGLFQIAQSIRKAISVDDNPPIAELIETGVMPFIMDLLKTDNNQSIELVVECLWIAANVTSGKAESVKYLVDLDLIPIAFQLLEHQNPDIKENVIWILANLAGDSKVYRSALLKKGLASKIDALLTDNSLGKPIISGTVWLMSNLCRSKPYPEFGEVASFLSYIEYFLKNSQDEELIEHCMAILCAFTDTDDEEQIQEVVDTDVYNELFAMIREGNSKIRGYAVKTIGNIISHTDEHTEGLVEKGLVGLLLPVLDDQVKLIKKNACWTYANILACTPSQVDKVFEFESGKIVKKLFQMALSEDKEIARECVYALSNSCDTGSVQEIDCLVSEGFIEMMVEIFINSNDKDLIQACLTALSTILSEGAVMGDSIEDNPYYIRLQQCDGIAVLEKLQNFASDEMFRVIEEILDEFLGKN